MRGTVPAPSERELLRALRVPHAQELAEIAERGVRGAIAKARDRALVMASFEATLRTAAITAVTEDELRVRGAPEGLVRSPSLARRFGEARELLFVAVTLGEAWDEALDTLAARGEPAEAWFLDALGTLLVDRAARLVEARVERDLAREGLARAGRYRPGYDDLPLEAQGAVCAFVEAARIGVSANEAMSLWPRKSVTTISAFVAREEAIVSGAKPS